MNVHIHGGGVLGRKVEGAPRALDVFDLPGTTTRVVYTSDEFTAVCPVTGQPDWYTVRIILVFSRLGIESKSLKLYLQSYRNEGAFCEALADIIATDVARVTKAGGVEVTLHQKSRGGITIEAHSYARSDNGQGNTQQDVSVRGGTPPAEPLREVP